MPQHGFQRLRRRIARVFRHLACDRRDLDRAFPASALDRIERRIAEGERRHGAEVRVAIEASLAPRRAWADAPPRDRALEVFGRLRVWDTEANNGVLIHLLLADRSVEIVADRGAARVIEAAEWRSISEAMAQAFRTGRFVDGVLEALDRLEPQLAQAFPPDGPNPDELPNRPAVI
jgi:uncharacterized membrane protein